MPYLTNRAIVVSYSHTGQTNGWWPMAFWGRFALGYDGYGDRSGLMSMLQSMVSVGYRGGSGT